MSEAGPAGQASCHLRPMRITAIERQRRRPRANVFVDGRFALALALHLAQEPASTPAWH